MSLNEIRNFYRYSWLLINKTKLFNNAKKNEKIYIGVQILNQGSTLYTKRYYIFGQCTENISRTDRKLVEGALPASLYTLYKVNHDIRV